MKRHAQQSALAARNDKRVNVEKGRAQKLAVLQHAKAADLFDDEEATRPVLCVRCVYGALKAVRKPGKLERVLVGACGRRRERRGRGHGRWQESGTRSA